MSADRVPCCAQSAAPQTCTSRSPARSPAQAGRPAPARRTRPPPAAAGANRPVSPHALAVGRQRRPLRRIANADGAMPTGHARYVTLASADRCAPTGARQTRGTKLPRATQTPRQMDGDKFYEPNDPCVSQLIAVQRQRRRARRVLPGARALGAPAAAQAQLLLYGPATHAESGLVCGVSQSSSQGASNSPLIRCLLRAPWCARGRSRRQAPPTFLVLRRSARWRHATVDGATISNQSSLLSLDSVSCAHNLYIGRRSSPRRDRGGCSSRERGGRWTRGPGTDTMVPEEKQSRAKFDLGTASCCG